MYIFFDVSRLKFIWKMDACIYNHNYIIDNIIKYDVMCCVPLSTIFDIFLVSDKSPKPKGIVRVLNNIVWFWFLAVFFDVYFSSVMLRLYLKEKQKNKQILGKNSTIQKIKKPRWNNWKRFLINYVILKFFEQ